MLTQTGQGSKQHEPYQTSLSREVPGLVTVGVVILLLTTVSWQRWVAAIADSGRELDLPRRLLDGELLYRDVHYMYGPLAPYLKMLLYSLFGTQLSVLQISGFIASLLLLVIIYAMSRHLLGVWEASLATTAVAIFCVFKPGGNLISPYSYAALFALVISLSAVLVMIAYVRGRNAWQLLLAGMLTGLTAVTKLEFALAALAAVLVGLAVAGANEWERDRGVVNGVDTIRQLSRLLLVILPILVIVLPVYAYFFHQVGWRVMVEDCHILYTNLPGPMVYYNARRSGLDQPWRSFLQLLGGGLVLALLMVVLLAAADPGRLRSRLRTFIPLTGMLLGGIAVIRLIVGSQWDGSPLRFMPVLLMLVIIAAWRGAPARLIVATYSLAVLARVSLRVPSGGAFGSFFLPGSLVVLTWVLFNWLPVWSMKNGLVSAQARVKRVVFVTLVAVLAATTVVYAVRYRRTYSYRVETARGAYYAAPSVGPAFKRTIEFIEANTRPSEPVVVLPEGSDLTFLAGRHHPLRHQILVPGLMSMGDEIDAIRTIERLQVRYILVVNRPMREFGLTSFGEDFYPKLGGWIRDHYRLVNVEGGNGDPNLRIGDPVFFIKIYARPNHPPAEPAAVQRTEGRATASGQSPSSPVSRELTAGI